MHRNIVICCWLETTLSKRKDSIMEDVYKEVYFGEYCKKCKYLEKKENEEPCDECLENPVNLYSHKPVNYKEKE